MIFLFPNLVQSTLKEENCAAALYLKNKIKRATISSLVTAINCSAGREFAYLWLAYH